MSSSLSKRWVCVLLKTYLRFFLSEWPLILLWEMRIYIVWVKGKKVTLKNPLGRMFCEYLAGKAFLRDSHETFCLEDFNVWLSYPSPILYIPSLLTNVWGGHSERKTLDRFSTTHTPIFLRESYLSLVRNHCSLFSIPLPLTYLERRFVPKHNPHLFRVLRVFWSCWEALEEAKDDRCNMKLVAGSGELDKTRFREALLE